MSGRTLQKNSVDQVGAHGVNESDPMTTRTMNGGRGMMVRKAVGQSLALLGASVMSLGMMVGCEHRNDDINRVQPGYVRKAIFQQEDEWYYRRTIAEVGDDEQRSPSKGQGDIWMDRVKFRIQEQWWLIAYKPLRGHPGLADG